MRISNEAKIGMMVFSVLIVLAIFTIKAGDFDFSKKGYQLKATFKNVDGVSMNSPVMLNGLEVGKVENITLIEDEAGARMELLVFIKDNVKIHEGAKAYVKNMGFMGEKYVGLTSGNVSAPHLKAMDTILGRDPADLDSLLLDAQDISSAVKQITQNINERLTKNKDSIDKIFAQTESVTASMERLLTENKENLDNTFGNLKSTAINLDQFTYDLKQHPWKLLYRSKDVRQANVDLMLKDK